MRILAVTDAERWFNYHIIGSLRDLGHEVHTFIYGSGSGDFYGWTKRHERLEKNQGLVDLADRMKCDAGLDLIFCYVYDDFLTVHHARALAKLGVPMVNYNVDMANQWYRQIRIGPYFTYVLCAQRANMNNLSAYGIRAFYFPMAARPTVNQQSNVNFVPFAPVTFLGRPMPYREAVLAELERAGIALAVYGPLWRENRVVGPERSLPKTLMDIFHYAWPRLKGEGVSTLLGSARERFGEWHEQTRSTGDWSLSENAKHGELPDGALAALFGRSTINLGFTRLVGSHPRKPGINQVKLRDFEVPLEGGFYLVEEAPDHAELFALGKEVATWRTTDELIEKVRYYLEHEAERVAIAKAGQQRARADHTWSCRFEKLFAALGIG